MPNGGRIDFQVGFKTDKSGLNQLNKVLWDIQDKLSNATGRQINNGLGQAADSAKKLQSILNEAWNSKLGQLNLDKVNQGIKDAYGSVQKLSQSLDGAGKEGRQAFNTLASGVLNTNLQIKESNALLNDFADTFGKTVKYGIASSVFNNIKNSLQQAFYFAKDLDLSLTNIRIVTGDSAENMERFSKTANQAAKNLGRSTLDYTNAALTFYQQGLGQQDVNARTQATMMAQNITGTGTQMADYLTAVWNGYKVGAEEAVEYVDKLAAVADSSASDMSQLAIAMSKVASAANVMGVDSDQLNAQLATVIATTRQAPESIGTAFKTIYARINDIKAGTDQAEISLGNYSGKMASLGFNVFDTNGKLKDTGDVIEEVGERWGQLSREQQLYLAQVMGGTRQYSRLISLFDNWNMYTDMLNVSLNSQGTLLEKNDRYMDSVKAHMEKLNAETERMYMILSDTGAINTLTDVFRDVLNVFNDYIAGLGGGLNVIINFGSQIANLFNNQIGKAINQQLKNIETYKANLGAIELKEKFIAQIRENVANQAQSKGYQLSETGLQKEANIAQKLLKLRQSMTQEQYNELTALQQQIGLGQTRIDQLEKENAEAYQLWNISENSTRGFNDRLAEEKENLQILQDEKQILTEHLAIYKNLPQNAWRKGKVQEDINLLLSNQNLSIQQRERLEQIIIKLQQGEQLSNQDIRNILQSQNRLLKEQQGTVKRLKDATDKRKLEQDERLQQQAREKLMRDETAQLQRQQKIATAVKGITAGVQGLTAIVGGLKVITDQTATTTEKVQAGWSAAIGSVSAFANAIAPGTGFLIQGLGGLVKGALELTGVWDKLIHHFETSQQTLVRIKKNQDQINNSQREYANARKEIEGIREDYERLSKKSGEFTDEEQARWNEIASVFEKYNSDVIIGYDQQGDAIIRKNANIDDSISKLQDEYDQIIANKLALQDMDDYSKPYEDAVANVNEARTQVASANFNMNSKLITDEDKASLLGFVSKIIQNEFGNFQNLSSDNQDFNKFQQAFAIKWETATSLNEAFEAIDSFRAGIEELIADAPEDSNKTRLLLRLKEIEVQKQKLQQQYITVADQNRVSDNQTLLESSLASARELGVISPQTAWQWAFQGQNFKYEKNKLTNDQWKKYGENAAKEAFFAYIEGVNAGFLQDFDNAAKTGATLPKALDMETVIAEADQALAGLFDNIKLNEIDTEAKKMQQQLQKKANDSIEHSIAELNKIRTDAAKKVYDAYSEENKAGEKGSFIRYILGNAFGVNFDEDGNISTDQLQNVQDTITSAIDGILQANPNLANNLVSFGNTLQGGVEPFKQKMLAMSDETFSTFITWLDTANLKGVQTFEDILKAFQNFQNETKKTDLEASLGFDDITKSIEKLAKGDSITGVAKGAAVQYVKYLMRTNEELREIGKTYGINSKQFAKAWADLEIANKQKQLDDQNKKLEEIKQNLDDIEHRQGEYTNSTESELAEKKLEYTDKQVDSEFRLGELQGEMNQLVEAQAAAQDKVTEKIKTRLQLLQDQKKLYSNQLSAYENMSLNKDLTDDQYAAITTLESQNPDLAALQRGTPEYLQAFQEALIAARQQAYEEKNQNVDLLQQEEKRIQNHIQILKWQLKSAEGMNRQIELKQQLQQAEKKLTETTQQRQSLENTYFQSLTKNYDNLADIMNGIKSMSGKLSKGELLDSSELYQYNLMLLSIKQKYPQLIDLVETLSDTGLAGTEKYNAALDELQNKLSNISLDSALTELEQSFDKLSQDVTIHVEIDETKFQQWKDDLDKFLSQDRKVSISIDNALKEEFNSVKADMAEIYDAASKIGQNFIVAANDISALAKAFPGITQGMQALANGSFQLNQQVVQQTIGLAKTEVSANTEAMAAKMQNEANFFRSKANIYKRMKEIAHQFAVGEVTTEEQKTQKIDQLNDNLNQLREMDRQKVAEFSQKMDNVEIQATEDAANSMVAVKKTAGEKEIDISNQVTDAVVDNRNIEAQALVNSRQGLQTIKQQGQAGAARLAGIGTNIKAPTTVVIGADGVTQDTFDQFEFYNQQDWQKLENKFDGQIQYYNSLADSIEADILGLQGQANKTLFGLDNVAGGYGINGPKEEKQKQTKEKQPAKPSVESYLKEEFDRYHDINIIIQKINRQLKIMESEQKKLVGKDLINNYQKQLDLLNQQIEAQKQKMSIAQQEAGELRGMLSAQGVGFYENGQISNYLGVLSSKQNAINSYISYYNSLTKEEQEYAKGVLDSMKEEYDDLKKNISRYDELINNMIPDLADQIREETQKKVEIAISKSKMAVDIKIDLSQLQRDYNKFIKNIKKQVQDWDILGNTKFAFKDLQSFFKGGIYNSTKAQTEQLYFLMDQIRQINQSGFSNIYGDNKKQALDDLNQYRESLEGDLQSVLDLIEQIKQNIIKAIEQVQEGFENRQKYYDHISGLLDHDLKLVELIYGDKAYQKMQNLYKMQYENDLKHLAGLREKEQYWDKQLQQEREHQKNLEKDSNAWHESQERIKKFEQNWMDATNRLNSAFSSSIQNIINEYQTGVKKIYHDLELQLFNGHSFEYIQEEWELAKKQSDMYLDNINRSYALDKLNNGYDKLSEKTKGNLKAQKQINAAREAELGTLRQKEKLTQGQIDVATRRLQILEMQIALEDSRNNRSTLQLRRDSQGNYSYQYAADEDDTADKLQQIKDAQNELYNFTKNLKTQAYDEIPRLYQQMANKITQIDSQMYLSDKEKTELKELTHAKYMDLINKQAQIARDNDIMYSKEALAAITDGSDYSYRSVFDPKTGKVTTYLGYGEKSVEQWAEDNKGIMDRMMQYLEEKPYAENKKAFYDMIYGNDDAMLPTWRTGVGQFIDKIIGAGGLQPLMQGAMDKLQQQVEDYRAKFDNLADAADIDTDRIGEGVDIDIEKTQELMGTNEELLQSYQNVYDEMVNYWIPTLENYIDKHRELKDAIDAITEAYKLQMQEQRRAAEAATQMTLVDNSGNIGISSYDDGGAYGGYGGGYGGDTVVIDPGAYGQGGGGGGSLGIGSRVIFTGQAYYDPDMTSPIAYGSGQPLYISNINPGHPAPYHLSTDSNHGNREAWIGWATIDDFAFKSGGYTGDWNAPDGKWALLHQKELVLNAQDTENILSAVNIARSYSDALNKMYEYQKDLLLHNMNDMFSSRESAPVEQNVYITADFPDVRSYREIEMAFENLTNRASQYLFSSR